MRLFSYWASSAAYRVRIALNLKDIGYEIVPVSLTAGGGEHKNADYLSVNPQGLVPALETRQGVLSQSVAILDYLEEVYPKPALLPSDSFERARVRGFALLIACDIHPVNNLRIRRYLAETLAQPPETVETWYRHWIEVGFAALEAEAGAHQGPFCLGVQPSLADVCLVPQMYNARRFDVDLTRFPRLVQADTAARALGPVAAAAPKLQPDAPKEP